jgi:hypothetical protein
MQMHAVKLIQYDLPIETLTPLLGTDGIVYRGLRGLLM